MFKKFIKKTLALSNYEIKRIQNKQGKQQKNHGFVLHPYLKDDGSFDYSRYREVQVAGNKQKIQKVWVREENIAFLSDYIKRRMGKPKFGLCHGTRRGKEQEWFRKYLDNCEVIGTEISDNATEFPHTIQWDFHEVKPEWVGATDFIYSNAIDHSYNPEKCLNAWMSCLSANGICILDHSPKQDGAATSELDPFGADIAIMPYLITIWGKGNYGVREILDTPGRNPNYEYQKFIIIQKF